MRALLALDGSASAETARQAVVSLAWPTGSVIHVLGVVDWDGDLAIEHGGALPRPASSRRTIAHVVEEAVAALQRPDLAVEGIVTEGRAASVIVDEATRLRAELIVVGSRGRGPIASMLLGSVSAEVVDHAPCPVLVVRGPLTGSILVAVDGSPSADAAVTYLTANRLAADRRLEVVSVADSSRVEAIMASPRSIEAVVDRRNAQRVDLEVVAARAAMRLRATGHTARWSVLDGHPAQQIITTATDLGCGLIVMGSRGMTGLKRLLVGSVARTVLLHAAVSVLIVHEPVRAMAPEPAEERHVRASLVAGTG